jgi:hypothetical protein
MLNKLIYVPIIKSKLLTHQNYTEDQEPHRTAIEQAQIFFDSYRWWSIADEKMIYDRDYGLIWFNVTKSEIEHDFSKYDFDQMLPVDLLERLPFYKKMHWTNPTYKEDLCISDDTFPLAYLTEHDLLLPVSRYFKNISLTQLILTLEKEQWLLKPYNSSIGKNVLKDFYNNLDTISAFIELKENSKNKDSVYIEEWQYLDYLSTRLPIIDQLRFTDINQGMWEFYTPNKTYDLYIELTNPNKIRPRNPELDIRNAKVAIDFGTSSTVVAIRNNGRDELLRIGLQEVDFDKNEVTERDFENPTILEFLNINALKESWHSEVYRPLVNWSDVHCSHEAQSRLRQNNTDTVIVGSMLARLKQWALRDEQQAKVKITDSKKNIEFEFDYLKELNPTKGQPITLEKEYPDIDPIELYAWFLGMNINWRERGIYLTYYLTFPVAYPSETKRKILASFRRGLQRSLPLSLMYSQQFNDFSVTELASEPAAFAAAALPTLKIEPTEKGVAYAVFDFGGGTTDFDYGIYRTPNNDEFDDGWDDVIEHFGSSGDKFLGGENLIENIAYLTFKANQDACRDKQVIFTKPMDAEAFVGSERLISNSQSALTNTTMLMSKLRPYWEDSSNQNNKEPLLKLRLLNRNNELVDCELAVDKTMIDQFLHNRLNQGLLNFFAAMKDSYEQQLGSLPTEIHILLAGNSSRSSLLQTLLEPLEADILEGFRNYSESEESEENVLKEDMLKMLTPYVDALGLKHWNDLPIFIFHKPLINDKNDPYKPNTKTGVALGLLRISPGETLKVINHDLKDNSDSLFPYYVGTHRRNIFEVGIKRGDDKESWIELGRVRQGIFPLLYTTQPQALNGMQRGTNGLHEKEIEFSGDMSKGMRVFGKIVDSNSIELCLVENQENINEQSFKKAVDLNN